MAPLAPDEEPVQKPEPVSLRIDLPTSMENCSRVDTGDCIRVQFNGARAPIESPANGQLFSKRANNCRTGKSEPKRITVAFRSLVATGPCISRQNAARNRAKRQPTEWSHTSKTARRRWLD
jgi:predicted acyl esterase